MLFQRLNVFFSPVIFEFVCVFVFLSVGVTHFLTCTYFRLLFQSVALPTKPLNLQTVINGPLAHSITWDPPADTGASTGHVCLVFIHIYFATQLHVLKMAKMVLAMSFDVIEPGMMLVLEHWKMEEMTMPEVCCRGVRRRGCAGSTFDFTAHRGAGRRRWFHFNGICNTTFPRQG